MVRVVPTLLVLCWLVSWLIRRSTTTRRLLVVHALAPRVLPWLAFTGAVTGRPFLATWEPVAVLDELAERCRPRRLALRERRVRAGVARPAQAFFTAHAHDPLLTQNRELERQAWRNIVHHPGKYAQNLAANASRIFFNAPYSRRPLDLRAVVFIVPGALLLALLALSTVRSPVRERSCHRKARRSQRSSLPPSSSICRSRLTYGC